MSPNRESRITILGGVMGPLELVELKEAKKAIDKVLKSEHKLTEGQAASLDKLNDYVQNVIDDHTTVGRMN